MECFVIQIFFHSPIFFDDGARNIASGKAAGTYTVIVRATQLSYSNLNNLNITSNISKATYAVFITDAFIAMHLVKINDYFFMVPNAGNYQI